MNLSLPSEEQWLQSGDAARNSSACWWLAVSEIRKRGLRSGEYSPENEAEAIIARESRAGNCGEYSPRITREGRE